jgi:uncharacterized protein (DUF1800 family)
MSRGQVVAMALGLMLAALAALAAPAEAQIQITQLSSVDASGRCTIRPTVGATLYARMTANGLSHAQLLHHASSRLGFGPSPIGPLTVAAANDCSTVFVADELARQLTSLGAVADTAQLTTIRRGLFPLTMFDRAELSGALWALRQIAMETSQTTSWEARTSHTYLKTMRELVGSQRLVGGALVDVQLNLDEVMLELWIDHFNIELEKPSYYAYGQNGYTEVLRRAHGGTFAELLTTAMRQPGLLFYLDNQANLCDPVTGAASNQNLAREMLELHTLGVGPTAGLYGQADVEAVASALCGWNVVPWTTPMAKGHTGFVFNGALASPRPLTIMGKTYPASGEARVTALLADLANHTATRASICAKVVARFHAPSLRAAAVDACVTAWGTTGDLEAVLGALLQRDAFWTAANYRALQRTPIELVVAVARRIGVKLTDFATATTSRGLTEAPFAPAQLADPVALAAALATLRGAPPYKTVRELLARIEVMLGFPRLKVPPPTGYPMDGAAFLSSAYVDDASRLGLDVASSLNLLADRTDLSSAPERQALDARLARGTDRAAIEWFLEERMKLGNAIAATPTGAYALVAAHVDIVAAVIGVASAWVVHVNKPTIGRSSDTVMGLVLGSAYEMWR